MYYQIVPMDRSHIPQIAQLEQICFSVPWTENTYNLTHQQKSQSMPQIKPFIGAFHIVRLSF